jgi:hypothetical protein
MQVPISRQPIKLMTMDQQTQEFLMLLFTKVLPPLATAIFIPFAKKFFARSIRRKSKAIEDLEFLSAFLAFGVEKRNRLVVEQAFAGYLKHKFDYEELASVLKFKNPMKGFRLLKASRQAINLEADGAFCFKREYSEGAGRLARMLGNFLLYIVLFYLAAFPLMYVEEGLKELGIAVAIPLIAWVLPMMALAFGALTSANAISAAGKLLEEQQKAV